MKSFQVRDQYSALKDFALGLPDTFDHIGSVMQDNRNVIKKVVTPHGTFVVKNFKGMYLFNRLAYSLFRKSKAARSYLYSDILNSKGIITPPHVAWVDCYRSGLLIQSYFVSVYDPHTTLRDLLDYYEIYEPSYKEPLLRHLAAFALRLHRLGIYHEDFSLGNILVIQKYHGFDFALVDLNRIKFHDVSYAQGLHNFATLRLQPMDLNKLIREYAILSNRSPEESIMKFSSYNERKLYLRRLRRNLRRNTITRFERILNGSVPAL